MTTQEILQRAKSLSSLPWLETEQKNQALLYMADALEQVLPDILAANQADVHAAKGRISEVMLDRLSLTPQRIAGMAEGIRTVAALPDPVGQVLSETRRADGLRIQKTAVPMGVVAIIYESRPNVTSDAAALALKSGNVCILRCGREALASAKAIVAAMQKGLTRCGVEPNFVQIVEDPSRNSALELMQAEGYVDLLIPRGGAGLIQTCLRQAKVPCIQTGTGICHIFVDETADAEMALNIIENAKTSRPSVCNAAEVLLVHHAIAETFLPCLQRRLCSEKAKHPVELRCDRRAAQILQLPQAQPADFDTEFLDYILAVAVVENVKQAVKHIAAHSTHHSEAIVTESAENAQYFTRSVDSAAVYVNASTRFTDGGEFGLGCEMGISTQKLHARGPMGLRELTTYKYIITGNGQVRG